MIKDRLISLFDKERTTVWFEQQTGIGRYRWQNIKSGKARLTDKEIEAVMTLFPAYRWWLMTGDIKPEIGQTSPEYDGANAALKKHGEG
ncbi:MAG TPA: DNA-binding protein [Alcanivorax sp.]|jgi:hypothetical protein|nr:DNA-binding protein [Alcanivorax sp.]